jgi:heme A synthase
MNRIRFHHFAWGLLFYNLLVIVWGAYVRASNSGDGCGDHWPSCGGELIPSTRHIPTWIEYSHRVSTSILVPIIIVLMVWAWRAFPQRRAVFKAACAVMFFTLVEGLIGMFLVKYGLVGDNSSATRAIVLSAHLANTFLLLGALAVTALWGGGVGTARWKGQGSLSWVLLAGLAGMMVVGVSGAVTALGDTLFPSLTLGSGIADDFSQTAHFLQRLRGLHPLLAISVSIGLLFVARVASRERSTQLVAWSARAVVVMFIVQMLAGLLNLFLLAPIWMQLLHLLLADILWLCLVTLTAAALAEPQTEVERLTFGEMQNQTPEVRTRWPVNTQSAP